MLLKMCGRMIDVSCVVCPSLIEIQSLHCRDMRFKTSGNVKMSTDSYNSLVYGKVHAKMATQNRKLENYNTKCQIPTGNQAIKHQASSIKEVIQARC